MHLLILQLKGCDAMRRLIARHAHAYRHDAPKQERLTPSTLGGLLSTLETKFVYIGHSQH